MTNVRNGTITQSFIIIMVNSMIVRLPVSLIIKSPIAQDNENSKLQFMSLIIMMTVLNINS